MKKKYIKPTIEILELRVEDRIFGSDKHDTEIFYCETLIENNKNPQCQFIDRKNLNIYN